MLRAARRTFAVVLTAVAAFAASALPAAADQQPVPGLGLSDTTPASSSTPPDSPSSIEPPPCSDGYCVPWVWYQATKIINNNALIPIPAFGTSMDNNTPDAATLTDMVKGSVQVTAGVTGKIAPPAAAIAGAVAELDPSVQGQATVETDKTVAITVRPGYQGAILFGVPAVLVKGYIHTRDSSGHVTSIPEEAWAPAYPVVFGFNAYVQKLHGVGPKSEVPVVPIPAAP